MGLRQKKFWSRKRKQIFNSQQSTVNSQQSTVNSKLISKLLSSAVKLYLRSQVTQVEDLQVKISGKNKQILKGYIPQVFLSCDRAIYQGLNLSQIELNGLDIAINLPEVIKKKPLRLLEPIFVEIKLKLLRIFLRDKI